MRRRSCCRPEATQPARVGPDVTSPSCIHGPVPAPLPRSGQRPRGEETAVHRRRLHQSRWDGVLNGWWCFFPRSPRGHLPHLETFLVSLKWGRMLLASSDWDVSQYSTMHRTPPQQRITWPHNSTEPRRKGPAPGEAILPMARVEKGETTTL